MKKGRFLMMLMALFVAVASDAQVILGTVTDDAGEAVIGATVVEKANPQNATITNMDGQFQLKVAEGKTLTVSFVGYTTQDVTARNGMKIVLKDDTQLLQDVVVIGYGVQKKSVVTASIAKVNNDDLAMTAPVRMDNALKGLASGVTVTSSSGAPGAAAQVRIRGIGTINNSNPLYIVDGMPIDNDALDFLNPSDIESMEVLKDAASGAIYGSRAANGVILITTKSGKVGKTKVNYNFSKGWSSAWKHRDVLNAQEYAVIMNEGLLNAGRAPRFANPYDLKDDFGHSIVGGGTDWQDLIFNDNAPTTNHEVSLSGASDRLNYYLSMGYYTQDGIIGGNYGASNYDRLTLRSNTKYTLFDESKERNWLNRLDLTANLTFMRKHSVGISNNDTYGTVLGSALSMSPILSPIVSGQDALDHIADRSQKDGYVPFYTGTYDANGIPDVYYQPDDLYYNEMGNPLAILNLPHSKGWNHEYIGSFMADLQLWDGLKYRFSYGAEQRYWGGEGYTPIYYIRKGYSADKTNANAYRGNATIWQVENTLSYDKIVGDHTLNVVVGQSAKKSTGGYVSGSRDDIISLDRPWINAATGLARDGKQYVEGAPYDESTLSSIFGRVSYDYAERYMVQATVRRDGSSHFGPNNHYATFPSFSLGWNVMNEQFMQKTNDWLSNLKVRFSWGKNGNENIANFLYTATAATGANNNYLLGRDEHSATGSKSSRLPNANLKWEESVQTDLGIDLGLWNNALTLTVDYYVKKTNGMLLQQPIPSYVGESKPWGNVGEMKNSGIEFEASYKWNIADAHFRISGNLSYLKNELINYGNDEGYANYDSFQGIGTITRAENGHPFPFFYGFKTDGVFQTTDEVNSYRNTDGTLIMPNARPGDVRFVDINGDGQITDEDQTEIGKGMPDWTFGLNFSAEWKGFDLNLMLQGVAGNEIFDATYRTDIESQNKPSWMLGRWTGPGTSNKYPIYRIGDTTNNWRSSDLYLTDGSYMRLKNLQIGYTLPRSITKKLFVDRLRVYVAAENLLTFTKYAGMDPEISSGATSLGVDYGQYPQPRTWTVGVNLGF